MKTSLILGILFLIIGGTITYIQNNSSNESFITFPMIIGALFGAGLGLIFGAIMGYNSKAQSVKRKAAKVKQDTTPKTESSSTTDSSTETNV